jgi:hypothetical protein
MIRLITVCLLFAAGAAAEEIPDGVKTRLLSLLPDAADPAVPPSGAPRFYASNLWEYMDGGADVYLTYGLTAMAHREYKGGEVEVNADIFDMGQPLNAFGIYAAERSPDYHFIATGAEGYSGDFLLNFLQDRFYVKLSGFGDPGKAAPVLERFAGFVSERIGPGKSLPAVLGLFPQQNLVAHSQKYIAQAPLGHEFLAPALQATYSFDGEETLLLISLARDTRDAGSRAGLLEDSLWKSGTVQPDAALGPGVLRSGDTIFFARGPYLVVCVHPPVHPEALLKAIDAQIIGTRGDSRVPATSRENAAGTACPCKLQ